MEDKIPLCDEGCNHYKYNYIKSKSYCTVGRFLREVEAGKPCQPDILPLLRAINLRNLRQNSIETAAA